MRSLAFIVSIGAVVALSAACDGPDSGGSTASESTVCSTVGTSWWNQSFADQTGTFHVEFAATPSRNNIDAVVGLSNGLATAWTKLAAIVRFAPNGLIDARNGSDYTYVAQQGYQAGETFWIKIDVDVRSHTYSAWASLTQGQYGVWNQVADHYAFRTEQASVTHLNNLAGYVNTTTPGSLQVCGFSLDTLPASGCTAANATRGFVNVEVTPAINSMVLHMTASPSTANMDGVIGVSSGVADEYNDLATSIRFYTNGVIEARDGDAYRADTAVTYSAGQQFDVMFAIDISNHTYSVFVRSTNEAEATELARGYHFRTQQQAVSRLDHVASIVASSTGRVDVCGAANREPLNEQYVREGRVDTQRIKPAPLADNGLLVSDGETTQKLDANGKIVGSLAVGGELAVDSDGSIYVAHTTQSTLTVDAFSATLAPRWSTTITNDFNMGRIAVSQGHVLVSLAGNPGVRVESFATSDGAATVVGSHPINDGTNIGLGAGFVFATVQLTNNQVSGFVIEAYDVAGNRRWTRTFPGNFWVSTLDVASDGSVVFGGEFYGDSMSFGDRTMYAVSNGVGGSYNGYVVALAPTGELRYSQQTYAAVVADIDATTSRIGVASFHNGDALWVDYRVLDLRGNTVAGCAACDFGVSPHGDAVDIALGASRVYLTVLHDWPDPIGGYLWPFTYALNL